MMAIVIFFFLTAVAHAFFIHRQTGAVCTGETSGRWEVDLYNSCHNLYILSPRNVEAAKSLYVTYTGRMDADNIIQFFNTYDCSGDVLAEGDNGCLDVGSLKGTPRSFKRVLFSNRKRAHTDVARLLTPHDTMNAARRLAGRPPREVPDLSNRGMELLALWPTMYVHVRLGKTLTDFWDLHTIELDNPFPDLNFERQPVESVLHGEICDIDRSPDGLADAELPISLVMRHNNQCPKP